VEAIERGEAEAVRQYYASSTGHNPNTPLIANTRETALHVAVRTGQQACVQELLALNYSPPTETSRGSQAQKSRVKLSVFDARNRTPLHYAAYYKVC
jgi:ankyrin repeat protein